MLKLVNMKVIIYGMGGLGVAIAKNIIITGIILFLYLMIIYELYQTFLLIFIFQKPI